MNTRREADHWAQLTDYVESRHGHLPILEGVQHDLGLIPEPGGTGFVCVELVEDVGDSDFTRVGFGDVIMNVANQDLVVVQRHCFEREAAHLADRRFASYEAFVDEITPMAMNA